MLLYLAPELPRLPPELLPQPGQPLLLLLELRHLGVKLSDPLQFALSATKQEITVSSLSIIQYLHLVAAILFLSLFLSSLYFSSCSESRHISDQTPPSALSHRSSCPGTGHWARPPLSPAHCDQSRV